MNDSLSWNVRKIPICDIMVKCLRIRSFKNLPFIFLNKSHFARSCEKSRNEPDWDFSRKMKVRFFTWSNLRHFVTESHQESSESLQLYTCIIHEFSRWQHVSTMRIFHSHGSNGTACVEIIASLDAFRLVKSVILRAIERPLWRILLEECLWSD